jgi:hypothetical protein
MIDFPVDFFNTLATSAPGLRRLQFLSDVEVPSIKQLALISHRHPQLRTLQFTRLHSINDIEPDAFLILSFTNLTTLSIGTWTTTKNGVLFAFMQRIESPKSVPNLVRFDLMDRSNNLRSFLKNHGHHLEHLTILSGGPLAKEHKACPSLTPDLKSLTFIVEGGINALPSEHHALEKITIMKGYRPVRLVGRRGLQLLEDIRMVKLDRLREIVIDQELPLSLKDPWCYDDVVDSFQQRGVQCEFVDMEDWYESESDGLII